MGEAIEYYAEQRGEERGILAPITSLMKTMDWSGQQAMVALELSRDDQAKYLKMMS